MRAAAVRTIALSMPEAEERETWGEATFRVRNKIFMMIDAEAKQAAVKTSREEQAALLGMDPATFSFPPYVGPRGWTGVQISRVDTGEMRDLITEAWRMTAPKRLVKAFDEGGT
ncbi:MAG TPA: MmcQ/YjbR family DNA-binding protein [Actinomycetota bacterium]|jgi:hypothetical protein|nr:MmcQ/YjbR family DNA-binding protein [Actinomycetota bacterium]